MKFRPYENKIWVLHRSFLLRSCGSIYLTMFVFQFILHIVKIWGTNTLPYPFTNGDTISIIMPILKAFLYFEGVDMLYVHDARRHICTPSSVMEKRFDFYVSCIQNYDKDLWGNFHCRSFIEWVVTQMLSNESCISRMVKLRFISWHGYAKQLISTSLFILLNVGS